MCLSSTSAIFMRCMWLINNGMSSMRSVSMFRVSFMPFSLPESCDCVHIQANAELINTYNDKSVNAIQVHLQRRIGCDRRLIKSGWIPGQAKYFHPKKQAEPDYEKCLKGHRYYQYGSYPL